MWKWQMLLSLEVHWLWGAATRYHTGRSIEHIVDIFKRGGLIIFVKVLDALG
jgi:hypothetical protein